MQLSYICEETKIRDLMRAGIVPEWMYRECEFHGMRIAEDFICEWDWEWGWDLGYGYNDSQLEVLQKARKTVSDGIAEYHRNPEQQKMEHERKDACKLWMKLFEELSAKLRPPFYSGEISPIVDYTVKYGEEPYFSIFYCWLTRYKHGTRTRIQMTMDGVFDGKQYTPEQIFEMSKDGRLEKEYGVTFDRTFVTLKKYPKESREIKGKLAYLLPELQRKLNQCLQPYSEKTLTEDHPVWQDIMRQENTTFDSALMCRALRHFFRM